MGDGPESPCRIRQLGIESQEIKPGVWGFPGSSAGKESACNGGDLGLIPGLGRSPDWEDPPEEGMVTHSSILAWRIPMNRSLAGYCPWGPRVGHD